MCMYTSMYVDGDAGYLGIDKSTFAQASALGQRMTDGI